MPVIAGLSTSTVRLANATFRSTFFPRAKRTIWPRICGTTKSSSMVEPFTFQGGAPLLKLFNGNMKSQGVMSYTINVPNPVFKNFETWKRNQLEFDQIHAFPARMGMLGTQVARSPDYLLACRMLKASSANSQTYTFPEDGKKYTMTLDNQPLYSLLHTTGSGTATQSNIITGHLPVSVAALNNQDMAVSANQMQNDVSLIIQKISTIVDDKGSLVYPDFDAQEQLVLIVPPALSAVADLAFRTEGTLGGSNGSSSGSTTNIGHKLVKDIIKFGLLSGCPDIESDVPGATVAPKFPTEYYWFVDGDYVKPWYYQRFVPVGVNQVIGESIEDASTAVMAEAKANGLSIRPEDADVYAATEIDYNLGALGANAQESVVSKEEFFISGRRRMQIFPGPWPCTGKVDPSASST